MSGGGGGGTTTSTNTTVMEPPKYVKPYAINLMNRAGDLSHQSYEQYPGERIAPLTPQHELGLGMTETRALGGSPYMNMAQAQGINTMAGGGVGPGMANNPYAEMDNPYLNAAIENAQEDTKKAYQDVVNPQLASMERASGAFGNSGLQQYRLNQENQLTKNLGNISQNMRNQDYQFNAGLTESQLGRQQGAWDQERANQMRAMAFAPQFAESDYRDAQAMLGVGDVYRDENQNRLNQQYNDWLAEQQQPYKNLDVLANAIRTTMGGGGTSVSSGPNPYQSNPYAGAIGGGLMGYGLANTAGWDNPWLGAGAGSLMGGLLL